MSRPSKRGGRAAARPAIRRPTRTATRAAQPAWIAPMLATLVEPRAQPEGWIYEPKLDGVRCLAVVDREARLWSRNRKRLDSAYPELVEALARATDGPGIFDGEVVAIDPERGVSSFSLLQQRMQLRDAARARQTGVAVEYWLFDCLFYRGRDLRKLPLLERKEVLDRAVRFRRPLVRTPFWTGDFETHYREICSRGGEGLIAKRAASPYVSRRSSDWLKLKCVNRQEFVIGGWTEPRGTREVLGALLVGYFDRSGKLRYAGKVGTGYDRLTLESLGAALRPLARPTSPFADADAPRGPEVHWVEPRLVAEIAFGEWTHDGHLRHPRFVGLREDKPARAVRRERPAQVAE